MEPLTRDGKGQPDMSIEEIARLIDHTLLKPEATRDDIECLCREARLHGFASVCVNSLYVHQASGALRGSEVKVCSVVGFPLGAQPPESKAFEARLALAAGATEIDMVIGIGALKMGDEALVLADISAVVEACRERGALLKVILETALLTDDEKMLGCGLCVKAGADYVKTSTGFSRGGATVEDVRLMSRAVAPKGLGVKASGGIRTRSDLLAMVRAGATRIGTSSGVRIVEEARRIGSTATGGEGEQ
jgi:deoxyribose-phosphate aldolase